MKNWETILEAVKDPFSLSALAVLVLALILRIALSKVKVLSGKQGFKTTIYAITVIGVIALTIAIGSIGIKYYELYIQSSSNNKSSPLTRIEVENILQSNRGNIERCLSKNDSVYFYVDFVFTKGDDGALNIDILAGKEALPELEFLHPQLTKKEVEHYSGSEAKQMQSTHGTNKLSVISPDTNGCILSTIKDQISHFSLDGEKDGFVHRYITDTGIRGYA